MALIHKGELLTLRFSGRTSLPRYPNFTIYLVYFSGTYLFTFPVFGKNAFRGKMRFGKNFTGPKRKLDRI
jgi:hypothetical protein